MELAESVERFTIDNHLDSREARTLVHDVRDGLTGTPKELPPKHLYDSYGSQLFERICKLPEYYPTRTERQILERYASEIAQTTGACELIELGAGSASKTRLLLDALPVWRYIPIDVSESAVRDTAQALTAAYPTLHVHGVIGDFERHLSQLTTDGPTVVALLGGTIGNFTPQGRQRLLGEIAGLLEPDDYLLLGTDLVKDAAVIEAAYDDSQGVTAEFNRNMLRVLNRELGADFDLASFEHVAFFDHENEWIEMRLRASDACQINFSAIDLEVSFHKDEELRTEISAKFTRERLERDYDTAGLELSEWYTDPDELFALSLACLR